jgi:hypothetical protein
MGKARQAPRRTLRSGPGREALPAGYHRVPASEGLGPVRGQRLATHRPLLWVMGVVSIAVFPEVSDRTTFVAMTWAASFRMHAAFFAHKRNRTLTIRPKRRRPRTVKLT